MKRVVLDTNIIISAFLSPAGKPANILQLVLQRELDIFFNTAILMEYEQVLYRPKFAEQINKQSVERFFEILHEIGESVVTTPSNIHMSDETDRIFYDVAKKAGALLITGNKKHYPDDTSIQDPAEFFQKLIKD